MTATNWATALAESLDSSWATERSMTGTMLPGAVSTALLTRRSIPSHSESARSRAASNPTRSWRSATSSSERRPSARIASPVSSRLPGSGRPCPVSESSRPSPRRAVRPVTATSQPAAASATAVARPMPLVAPVTRARLGGGAVGIRRVYQIPCPADHLSPTRRLIRRPTAPDAQSQVCHHERAARGRTVRGPLGEPWRIWPARLQW